MVEQREPPHRLAAAKLEYGGGKFQGFFECGRLHCTLWTLDLSVQLRSGLVGVAFFADQ
jgi:hypothetical protein